MTWTEIAVVYGLVAVLWSLTCVGRYLNIPGIVFVCLFWPLDFAMVLFQGARQWWKDSWE